MGCCHDLNFLLFHFVSLMPPGWGVVASAMLFSYFVQNPKPFELTLFVIIIYLVIYIHCLQFNLQYLTDINFAFVQYTNIKSQKLIEYTLLYNIKERIYRNIYEETLLQNSYDTDFQKCIVQQNKIQRFLELKLLLFEHFMKMIVLIW